MLDFAISFFPKEFPGVQIDLLVEPTGWSSLRKGHSQAISQVWVSQRPDFHSLEPELADRLKREHYDAIVMLYPDAIGLGWFPLERVLRRFGVPMMIVADGRRRVFLWSPAVRFKLYLRRILEKYWIFEILFSLSFVFSTPLLLLYDALAGMVPGKPLKCFKGVTERPEMARRPVMIPIDEEPVGEESSTKAGIRDWWARFPMTYGEEHGTTLYRTETGQRFELELGDPTFFEQVDNTFYSGTASLHTDEGHFRKIFDYKTYVGRRVLEVGCGLGTMSMNWAQRGALVTAVDLNRVAVEQTAKRFRLCGLKGTQLQADGESLPFPDEFFDYVYSWGVLHHTPGTKQAIDELHRVLKRGGKCGVMLYHRHSVLFGYEMYYREGFLHLENAFLTPLQLASRYTDGRSREGNPHTWPVTKAEVREVLCDRFDNVTVRVLDTDVDFSFLIPGVGRYLPRFVRRSYAQKWGWRLWITGVKS